MAIGTFVGTNAIIAHLSKHPATKQTTLCSRITVPTYRARKVYRAFLALLDQQPDISYTTQSSGKWWRRRRHYLVIIMGRAGAIQTAIHLLEVRHGRQR